MKRRLVTINRVPIRFLCAVLATSTLFPLLARADWRKVDAPSVPAIEDSGVGKTSGGGKSGGTGGTTDTLYETATTPELTALARGLRHDPETIYEFVRNRIDYVPTYGIQNGAHGCYLAGRGNEWDQCALLVSLLRESGYTCRFAYGLAFYYRSDLTDWLPVPPPQMDDYLSHWGGYSGPVEDQYHQELTNSLYAYRLWAEVEIDSTWYRLDPAIKTYRDDAIDIESASGYTATNLRAVALQGATVGTADVDDLNWQGVTNVLTGYTTNLLAYIRDNAPTAGVEGLLGIRRIVPVAVTNLSASLPLAYYVDEGSVEYDNHIDAANHLTFRVRHEGVAHTFKGYELGGKCLSVRYDAQDRPVLRLDDSVIDTGDATTTNEPYALLLDMHVPVDTNHLDHTWLDDSSTQDIVSGGIYVILHSHNNAGTKAMEEATTRVQQADLDGDATAKSVAVLYQMAQAYIYQEMRNQELLSEPFESHRLNVCSFGVVGENNGMYVDLPGGLSGALSNGDDEDVESDCFVAGLLLGSALEHGVIEQYQDEPSVSTIRLLALNVVEDDPTYLATTGTWTYVKSQIQSNYDAGLVAVIESNIVNNAATYVLPKTDELTLNSWSGVGYVQIASNAGSVGMIIDGGLAGGFGSTGADASSDTAVERSAAGMGLSGGVIDTTGADPVSLNTGGLLFDRSDLVLGAPGGVRGLALTQHYRSDASEISRGLGRGWRHGYDMRARETTRPKNALGGRTPTDAAAQAVQNMVAADLMSGDRDVVDWAIASVVTKWAMDQLTGNSATVELGNHTFDFSRQPGGSYTPPPGVTANLIKTNGLFRLVERFGKEYRFNTNGLLSSIVDADGNMMSLAYNAQTNLQTVTDAYSRTLTFGYTGDNLSTVTENAGGLSRSVSFGYTDDDLTSFTDPDGGVWEYAYDTNHQIVALIDPLDQVTTSNIYNDVGQVVTQFNGYGKAWAFYCSGYEGTEVDPEGGETTHYFDDDGRNLGTEDALGNRTYNYYDAQGHLVSNVNARGFATIYQYDDNHNLTNRIDALGNAWRFQYDAAHHLVAAADPLGNTNRYGYSATHHLTNTVDALTNSTAITYYSSGAHKGLPQTVTDRNGNVTTYTYKDYGAAYTIARTDGGTVTNTWNARGDLLVARDANGNPTTSTYNNRRLLVTVTDAMNNTVSNTWNAAGLKTKVTDPLNRETVTTWTSTYQVDTITYPDTGVVRHHYDDRNLLVNITDARGNSVSNVYDSAQRKVATILDPDGLAITTRFVLDANGNVIAATNALDKTTSFVYDKLDRLVQTTDPLNHSVSNTFDVAARLVAVTDAKGYTTEYEYDDAGRKTGRIKPDGVRESYTLDANGNMTAFENGLGQTRTFGYDGMNRVTNETDAVSNARSFVFDAAGNLLERHDADGAMIEYDYDDLNRLLEIVYPDTGTVRYAYNEVGLRTYQSNAIAEVWYGFDVMDRLSVVTQSVGSVQSVVAYSHDLNGNRTAVTYPGNKTVTYGFDAANRLTNVNAAAIASGLSMGIQRDDLGRVTGKTYGNGATGAFDWDDASRLTGLTYLTNATAFIDREYTVDAHGNITAMDIEAGLLPVVSPNVMRLKQNAADELTSVQTKANPGIQDWTTATPTLDAEGNLLTDGTLTLAYDYENRLASVQSVSSVVLSYYAGDGSRVARSEDGTTRIHVLDHGAGLDAVLITLDTNGVPVRYYLWAGSLAAHVDAGGFVRYYHADHQGTTLALSDGNGAVTDQWFISPYGEQMNRSGTTATPYVWIGGHAVWNEGNGLYRMQARHYHATLKRWTARDPVGMAGGANLYAYALGSPLILYDPWGLCAEAWYQREIIPGSSLQDMGMYASHGAHGLLRSPGDMAVGAFRGVQGVGTYLGNLSGDASGTWDATVNAVQSLPETVPAALNNWANDPQAIGSTVGQIGIGIGAARLLSSGSAMRSGGDLADDFLRQSADILGDGATIQRGPAGGSNFILRSADGTRQIRIDLSNPHGLQPHVNIETFAPRNAFPSDVRMINTGNIHAFPGGQ